MSASTAPWQDPDVLRELYVEKKLTQKEVGERLGCSGTTIRKWMGRHGIPARDPQTATLLAVGVPYAKFGMNPFGYEVWKDAYDQHGDGPTTIFVHQLLAIANGEDPADVFDPDTDIHHKNGVKWDNRSENIRLVKKDEHTRRHHTKHDAPWHDQEQLERAYETASTRELADRWGCSSNTISRALARYGIEPHPYGWFSTARLQEADR